MTLMCWVVVSRAFCVDYYGCGIQVVGFTLGVVVFVCLVGWMEGYRLVC